MTVMVVLGAVVLSLFSSFLVYATVFGCGSFRHNSFLSAHAWAVKVLFTHTTSQGRKSVAVFGPLPVCSLVKVNFHVLSHLYLHF